MRSAAAVTERFEFLPTIFQRSHIFFYIPISYRLIEVTHLMFPNFVHVSPTLCRNYFLYERVESELKDIMLAVVNLCYIYLLSINIGGKVM